EKNYLLDKSGLENMKFLSDEPVMGLRDIQVDIAQDLNESGGTIVSSHEAEELEKLGVAHGIQQGVKIAKALASGTKMLPDGKLKLHFWGLGGDLSLPGGEKISGVASLGADIAAAIADQYTYEAKRAEKIGAVANRQRDWAYQSNLVALEIT